MPTGKRGSRPFYTARRCGRARSFLPLCITWGRRFFNTVCFPHFVWFAPRLARPKLRRAAGIFYPASLRDFIK